MVYWKIVQEKVQFQYLYHLKWSVIEWINLSHISRPCGKKKKKKEERSSSASVDAGQVKHLFV